MEAKLTRQSRYVIPFLATLLVTWAFVTMSNNFNPTELLCAFLLQSLVGVLVFQWTDEASTRRFVAGTVAWLIAVALLRDSTGTLPGYGVLVMLPPVLAGLRAQRAEMAFAIIGGAVTLYAPELLVGGSQYPFLMVRGVTMLLVVSTVVSYMVYVLVQRLREAEAARERLLEEMATLASVDVITGVANRRSFDRQLGLELGRAGRHDRDLALVIIDIDRFKSVNDTYGHSRGDEVLRQVAATLRAESRAGETLARMGGEEFGWLMPDTTREAAATAADRAREAVEALDFGDGLRCTVSAGVSAVHGLDHPANLIDPADQALYAAKHGGRNQIVVALPPLDEEPTLFTRLAGSRVSPAAA